MRLLRALFAALARRLPPARATLRAEARRARLLSRLDYAMSQAPRRYR